MYKKSLNKKSLKKKLSRKQTGGSTNPFPFTLRQLTGTRTPYSSYMPVDPNQRGSAMFALGTLGEAAGNLFGGKDRDGDGLMDGAFRDLRAKRRRFKDNKGFGFTYKDQQGNPVVGDPRELYKASKDPNYTPRSPQQMMQDYQTYSRFGTDDQGRLQSFITDKPFDKRDFTNKGRLRNFFQDDKVTTAEEAYQQMQPASEFDFSPFMPKQKTRTVTRTVTKPVARSASGVSSGSGSTAVNTKTDPKASAVINGVTYTASDPVDNTANTPTAFDRSGIYNQIMDFEAKGGKYDPVRGGIPHGSFGNNIYSFTDDKGVAISPTDPRYRTMLADKMEEVYGKDVAGFSPEAQGAMIDFGYSTGNDPRIYLLDQYMKEQGLGDLPGRSDYNLHMDKYQ